jgi:hypothetical protein
MTYLYPAIDPARALVLASSPNETVPESITEKKTRKCSYFLKGKP